MVTLATYTYVQFQQHVQLAIEIERERHAEGEKVETLCSESGQIIYGMLNYYSKTFIVSNIHY
jgi:hypothetical protein